MVNASLADPATTGKCVWNKHYFRHNLLSDNGLSQQFSTAALPSNLTSCIDASQTTRFGVGAPELWNNFTLDFLGASSDLKRLENRVNVLLSFVAYLMLSNRCRF